VAHGDRLTLHADLAHVLSNAIASLVLVSAVAWWLGLDLPPMERVLRALLFGSGLRATSLCGLRVGDVTETPPQIRALMKENKVQVVRAWATQAAGVSLPPAVREADNPA
jgi:hypothetical protein